MSKWHNGPKGPGLCRAKKGGCPYGEPSEHFSSKEDAFEVYNKMNEVEFGILPSNKEKNYEFLIYNSNGKDVSPENFTNTGKGSSADNEYFWNKIRQFESYPEKLIEDLNKDPLIVGKWELIEQEGNETKVRLTMNKRGFGGSINKTFYTMELTRIDRK